MTSVRHVVVTSGFFVLAVAAASHVAAQTATGVDWRAAFAAGEQARREGADSAYAAEMAAAARAMPDGHLNRPFVQYHAARAAALQGRPDEALTWLRMAWAEGIESLMISFARFDPAFEPLVGSDAFEDVMRLPDGMGLTVTPVAGGVHLISGAGSNVVAQVGDDGVLLVDTGYEPALPALRRALEGLGSGDVRILVVTHPHEDHMGSVAALGAQATVIGHPATAAAMAEPYVFMEGVTLPPKDPAGFPDVEVVADTSFVFNGETVHIVATPAHTGGDLSVYFEGSRVAQLGDAYLAGNPMMFPGSEDPAGFLDRLEGFLESMDPAAVVVGGHEGVADLSAVRAQIATSRACLAFAEQAFRDGLTLEEAAEAGGDRFPVPWIAFFYGYYASNGVDGPGSGSMPRPRP
jgi:glyoxylase-like metal-dependent hydrolase (beta-lactamase superfamily II)